MSDPRYKEVLVSNQDPYLVALRTAALDLAKEHKVSPVKVPAYLSAVIGSLAYALCSIGALQRQELGQIPDQCAINIREAIKSIDAAQLAEAAAATKN